MNIDEAKREIAKVLQSLEKSTDSVVRSIALEFTEVTAFGDERRQLVPEVVIEMERLPGHNWG